MFTIEYHTNIIVVKKEGLPSYAMRLGTAGKIYFGKGEWFNLDNYVHYTDTTKPRQDYTVIELVELYQKAAKFYILRTKDRELSL